MAEKRRMAETADGPVQSDADLIRVKDLTSPDTNPNIPRGVLDDRNMSDFNAEDTNGHFAVSNRFHGAGKGFKSKSVTVKYATFDHGFDANDVTGNPGDVLVNVFGQWIVVPKSKFESA